MVRKPNMVFLFPVLMSLLLPAGIPATGKILTVSSGDPGGIIPGKGDTLLVLRGSRLDGCLTIESDSVTVMSGDIGSGELPVWTCTVPDDISSADDSPRAFGNCIIVRGRDVTIEGITFRGTLCDIPEDHPYIGTFESMWQLGAVRIDPSGKGCTVRRCRFEECGVGIKSNAVDAIITGNSLLGPSTPLRRWNWGPIGIWLGADCQEVSWNRIEGFRAEAAGIPWKTTGPLGADGGAIEIDDARVPKGDIDIHHNFSTGNQGFLEVTFSDVAKSPSYRGFRIHDNISDDYQSFVLLWSGTECIFEDNVIIRRRINGNEQAVFRFTDPLSHNTVKNNTILTAPGVRLFRNRKGVTVTFENNRLYHERNTSHP